MSSGQAADLDQIFGALAHPVRRAILDQVKGENGTVVELARPHKMSLNAISKHIKKLEAAGLISRNVDGNYHRITLNEAALKDALRWLSHYVTFWQDNLQSLKSTLEQCE